MEPLSKPKSQWTNSIRQGGTMKVLLLTLALVYAATNAFADHHEETKKVKHDKEHQHVEEGGDHEHEEGHHGEHDHKAHHPDHKDEVKKEEKKKK